MAIPEVVISVDFGTTFSGVAYAHRNDPNQVLLFYNWPGYADAAGGMSYPKTQTSLFYSSTGKYGDLELEAWGWPAFLKYTSAAQLIPDPMLTMPFQYSENNSVEIVKVMDAKDNVGYYITKFKLLLAPGHQKPVLPRGLSAEKLVSDYLRAISDFAIREVKLSFGQSFNKSKVKWCVTVPAIWDESAKELMEICAERAGMVTGAHCSNSDASPYPLEIVLEPEAASVYSQDKLGHLIAGDRFLVVDIGGGTIDLALHEKIDNHSLQVREAVMSNGTMGGGTFVDLKFLNMISKKIEFLHVYSQLKPQIVMDLWNWWIDRKYVFAGLPHTTAQWSIPAGFSRAWKAYDESKGILRKVSEYEVIVLNSFEFCEVFRDEVSKIIDQIKQQISSTEVRSILLVGGLAQNRYVVNCVSNAFNNVEVIVPITPGAAIVRLGFQSELVVSRVCKRTYGIRTCVLARSHDPSSFKNIIAEKNTAT